MFSFFINFYQFYFKIASFYVLIYRYNYFMYIIFNILLYFIINFLIFYNKFLQINIEFKNGNNIFNIESMYLIFNITYSYILIHIKF